MKFPLLASAFIFAGTSVSLLRARPETVWIGTYTNTTSRGIYTAQFDPESGRLAAPVLAAKIPNPSFLALGAQGKLLYAVDESAAGRVNAFAVEPGTAKLTFLNSQGTDGNGPAHLALDPSGKMVIAANYGGGSVTTFPITGEGPLGAESGYFGMHGSLGPDRGRQLTPHPHSIAFSPDGRFAFICDLGLDAVMIYRVDARHGSMRESDPASAAVPAGAGPRHSVFSSDGRFLYVLNEMGGSVCVFAWDKGRAALTLQQTISTLPEGFQGKNGSAEIALSPDGTFLYASNRGPNTITVFERDSSSGELKTVDRTPTGGTGPRSFAISPEGHWLICANEQSDQLVVFRIEQKTGRITATGTSAAVGRPVCLVFGGPAR